MFKKRFAFVLCMSRRKMKNALLSQRCVLFIVAAATGYIVALGTSDCNRTLLEALLSGPLSADDTRLLSFIKSSIIISPSEDPYNLKILDKDDPSNTNYNSYLNSSVGFLPLHEIVRQIFEGRPPGFFVEAGALDGEWLSNTLYLEKDKGWRGLLVEPDAKMFSHLLQKNRKSWSANCCLSVKDYPVKEALVSISNPKGSGEDVGYRAMNTLLSSGYPAALSGHARVTFDQVQCLPLRSLLKALDVSHVDFVSLDVEGVEDAIVRSFFANNKDITVDVWMVEHHHPTAAWDDEDGDFIQRFTQEGYTLHALLKDSVPFNYVFIRTESEVFQSILRID